MPVAKESGTSTRPPKPAASPTRGSLSPSGSTARQPRVDEEERVDIWLDRVVVDVEDDMGVGAPTGIVVVGGTSDTVLEAERIVEGLAVLGDDAEPEVDIVVGVGSG